MNIIMVCALSALRGLQLSLLLKKKERGEESLQTFAITSSDSDGYSGFILIGLIWLVYSMTITGKRIASRTSVQLPVLSLYL